MANGRLAARNITAYDSDTLVYTVPADIYTMMNITVCNRSTATRTIRIAVTDLAAPQVTDWIEYNVELVANGAYEASGVVAGPGQTVWVHVRTGVGATPDCNVVITGMEQPNVVPEPELGAE